MRYGEYIKLLPGEMGSDEFVERVVRRMAAMYEHVAKRVWTTRGELFLAPAPELIWNTSTGWHYLCGCPWGADVQRVEHVSGCARPIGPYETLAWYGETRKVGALEWGPARKAALAWSDEQGRIEDLMHQVVTMRRAALVG